MFDKSLGPLRNALKLCKEEALWQRSLHLLNYFPVVDVSAWDAATVACGRAGRWEVCLWLLHERWTVDTRATWKAGQGNPGCGATISSCARASLWPLALRLLAVARQQRQPLADSSCNAAISACVRVAAWSRALRILQEVPRANEGGYNVTIAVCSEGRQWERAIQLLQLMRQATRRPDEFTFSSLIAACHRSTTWEVASGLLDAMPSLQVTPNILSHCSMLTSYVKAYHWARALELFNHAILGGDSDSTNLVACTVAFQALQLAGPSWTRGAKRLSNHMGARHDVVSSSDSHPASIHA
ncbi:unnamed protein product [Durusdinium trenchii]|uniref:Pentatricopeptide repeat-containing protein n=1 Tax=Durusdinium trenchii TaxID=1381693 RepID=A0ABP0HCG8_9DINO